MAWPECGWHYTCTYSGPWQFVIQMALALLLLALAVWTLGRYLGEMSRLYPPADEDEAEPAPRPRRYHFDDEHLDRIARED